MTSIPRLEAFRRPLQPRGGEDRTTTDAAPTEQAAANPFVYEVARPARTVEPSARIGEVTEILRASPYSAVPVTENGRLVGMATERALVGALLAAPSDTERRQLREQPIAGIMEAAPAPDDVVRPTERVSDAAARFDVAGGADLLPVVDDSGRLLGLLARSDLVQDLVRPFRPPMVGGMATPAGVYLTTGAVSGGVSTLALVGAGLTMFLLQTLSMIASRPLSHWSTTHLPIGGYPLLGVLFGDVLPVLASGALLLLLVRISPVAGYHAAEHQVVHAIERAEPLLVDNVRTMPRVHPRCGTNLMAGALIATTVYSLTAAILAQWSPALKDTAYLVAGVAALTYWRTLGSWLQRHLTTRPATTGQIESGIRAARQLLERHGRDPYAPPPRPHVRLWRMGFIQMLSGFLIGYGLLSACTTLAPHLGALINPWLSLWL